MPYTALPDRRIPYDNDGTVIYNRGATGVINFDLGPDTAPTGAQAAELNDDDVVDTGNATWHTTGSNLSHCSTWFFFPETREVTAYAAGFAGSTIPTSGTGTIQGSVDTTNGVDGTWETASLTGGVPNYINQLDGWRRTIKAISFTGGKRAIRYAFEHNTVQDINLVLLHLYGEKTAGQTPNDLIFIDHDTTPGVEYQSEEDFGDRPLATSVVRQFRVKNVSPTLTANAVNIQCNDADFAISTDSITWVVTINIASLAPGAQSATMYIRNTTPAVGGPLGPRFARVVAVVGSYT